MNFIHSLQTALGNLRANKMRSMLTMLGVIIGVGAVIVMVAIIEGASARITNEFKRLGSSLIIVYYQQDFKDRNSRRIDGMKMEDVQAIQDQCPAIQAISAEIPIPSVKVIYLDRQSTANAKGVMPAYEKLRDANVATGRFITQDDMDHWARVCVIGPKIARDLFPDEDPIGKILQLQGDNITVVGVLAAKGRSLEGDADQSVYLPLATVQKRYIGSDILGMLFAEPKPGSDLPATMDQIWQVLMRRYDNIPGFHVDSQENILNSINKVLAVFGIILGSIAGLALLVGGIGIMNIMLVSVTERTREIGVRKAIGAKRRDILLQFLIESATVSGLGGLLGIALGGGTAYSIGYITQFVPSLVDPNTGARGLNIYLPVTFSLGAFAFSAGIGIFFGIYPAIRASRLDPIQALRTE